MNCLKNIFGRIASLFKRKVDDGDFHHTLNTGFSKEELIELGINYKKLDKMSCNFIVQLFPPYDTSKEICPVYLDVYYPITNSLGAQTIGDIHEKKDRELLIKMLKNSSERLKIMALIQERQANELETTGTFKTMCYTPEEIMC